MRKRERSGLANEETLGFKRMKCQPQKKALFALDSKSKLGVSSQSHASKAFLSQLQRTMEAQGLSTD